MLGGGLDFTEYIIVRAMVKCLILWDGFCYFTFEWRFTTKYDANVMLFAIWGIMCGEKKLSLNVMQLLNTSMLFISSELNTILLWGWMEDARCLTFSISRRHTQSCSWK